MSEHTEWHYQEESDVYTDHVRDVDNKLICSCHQAGKDGTTPKQHAEYIVRACNSHEDLLTICKKIKEAGDSTPDDCHQFLSLLDDCWDELEAAIKKAEE